MSETPVRVGGYDVGSGVAAVAGGGVHSLVLPADRGLLGWGFNYHGQLGNGELLTEEQTPVEVTGLGSGSGVVAVAAGALHSLALRAMATCWHGFG